MDCPHLSDVKIDRLFVRNKIKNEFNAESHNNSKRSSPDSTTKEQRNGKELPWKCLECSSEKENWMCLNCGKILCGRYVNSHALKHSSGSESHHKLCMNTLDQSVFCYKCDDFVINETAQLTELRRELQTLPLQPQQQQNAAEEEETTASSSSSSAGSTSTFSSMGRRLRPRKRTISSDSNPEAAAANTSASNHTPSSSGHNKESAIAATPPITPAAKRAKSAATKRVVGLRNLGNTCFMNSVLQSLSNIEEFSKYFYSLPSMEQIRQQRKSSAKGSSGVVSSSSGGVLGSGCGGLNGSTMGLSSKELEDANVVEELRKVLLNLGQSDGSKAISPECLFLVIWKVVPQFRGHRQHDAHEFLRYMLDRLHTELISISLPPPLSPDVSRTKAGIVVGGGGVVSTSANGSVAAAMMGSNLGIGSGGGGAIMNGDTGYGGSKRGSIVTNVFGGVLQSEVRCLICGMESKKHDPFLDLSLDIPEKFYSKEATATTNSSTGGAAAAEDEEKPACNISDCLFSFTEVEELAETELYYCNSCKCKQKSTKRFWIKRLPNVLCLHIKRFRWSNFFRTKIDLRINFPLKALDMSQFVLNNGPETRRSNTSNSVYDLAAVIVHHGNGSSCGHYTSYAHNSGTWLHFNDHTVKEVPASTVVDCKPYILFYTRRGDKAAQV